MDSKKLEILVTAADLGSFAKAAEVVGYTQSGLTHMMNSLEREIGLPLLVRNHNGVFLTEQAKALLPTIRAFLRTNAKLENQIQSLREIKTQTIRIAAYASIAMHWMPEILYRFRRICPEAEVVLRMVDHALEPFELLEAGQADVIFASRQAYGNCDWVALYDDQMYAILPRDFPLQDPNSFPLTCFAGLDFLMPYGRFDIDVEKTMQKSGVHLRAKPSYVDDETVIRMVGRGLGVSMMTELMIRGRTDDVLCVPVSPRTIRELGMGTHAGRRLRDAEQKLRSCVLAFATELQQSPPREGKLLCSDACFSHTDMIE